MKKIRARVEVLSDEEIARIHKASMEILERVGFSMPNEEALRRCAKAGAIVDYQKEIMRVPRSVMEPFLQQVRNEAKLPADQESREHIAGTISTQVFVVDYLSRQRRRGTSDDLLKGIALVQHLRNIPASNAVTVPSDVDPRFTDIHSYFQIYKYSRKGGGTYVLTPKSANYIMDMAEAMGRKEWYLFETISPFKLRRETLEMGLLFADRGHNLSIAPMILGGSTAPVTPAGMITSLNVEVLGSIFCLYALSGRIFPFYGHGTHAVDPATLLCSFGSPSQALIGMASAQMARHYGMPGGSNSALTDSLLPDFQGGFEKAANAIFSCLAGTVGIGCQGIAGADQGFSFEQLLIDNEWLDSYNFIVDGFEATEETIAQDLIERLGIGGVFIAEEHTVEHLRSSWWSSRLFDRLAFDAWTERGKRDLLDRAYGYVEEL
ncbi:MAG TPA: trimethylamine methyltransferase family protein, partial [Spirochaetia bacterium]